MVVHILLCGQRNLRSRLFCRYFFSSKTLHDRLVFGSIGQFQRLLGFLVTSCDCLWWRINVTYDEESKGQHTASSCIAFNSACTASSSSRDSVFASISSISCWALVNGVWHACSW